MTPEEQEIQSKKLAVQSKKYDHMWIVVDLCSALRRFCQFDLQISDDGFYLGFSKPNSHPCVEYGMLFYGEDKPTFILMHAMSATEEVYCICEGLAARHEVQFEETLS